MKPVGQRQVNRLRDDTHVLLLLHGDDAHYKENEFHAQVKGCRRVQRRRTISIIDSQWSPVIPARQTHENVSRLDECMHVPLFRHGNESH